MADAWADYSDIPEWQKVRNDLGAHIGEDGRQPGIDNLQRGRCIGVVRDARVYTTTDRETGAPVPNFAVLIDFEGGPAYLDQELRWTYNGETTDIRWVASVFLRATGHGGVEAYRKSGQEFGEPVALNIDVNEIKRGVGQQNGRHWYDVKWRLVGRKPEEARARMPAWFGGAASQRSAAPPDPDEQPYDDDASIPF